MNWQRLLNLASAVMLLGAVALCVASMYSLPLDQTPRTICGIWEKPDGTLVEIQHTVILSMYLDPEHPENNRSGTLSVGEEFKLGEKLFTRIDTLSFETDVEVRPASRDAQVLVEDNTPIALLGKDPDAGFLNKYVLAVTPADWKMNGVTDTVAVYAINQPHRDVLHVGGLNFWRRVE